MDKDKSRIIPFLKKQLSNDVTVRFFDKSRLVAGDRWLVSITCDSSIPLHDHFWNTADSSLYQNNPCILKKLGSQLIFTISKERHFVDEGDKEKIFNELLSQIEQNVLVYIQNPAFPERLFRKNLQQAIRDCQVQEMQTKAMNTIHGR